MAKRCLLPFREWRRLYRRAKAAQEKNLYEVVGLMSISRLGNIELHFLTNASTRPGHFETVPAEAQEALRQMRIQGKKYLGTFHSHPVSEAIPGPSDLLAIRPGEAMLIYDVIGVEGRLWKLAGNKKCEAREIPLAIQRSRKGKYR